ncbi:MAG: hypothetical protein WC281_17780 [Bosea sp. (in: a-proteobacteria)]
MMLALHVGQGVADRAKKIVVRIEDGAGQVELDDGLRLADGSDLALQICQRFPLCRDVGGELDDSDGFAEAVQNRRIGCLQPDSLASFGDSEELRLDCLAFIQARPKFGIILGVFLHILDKHSMVMTSDFIDGVANHIEEILVRCKDITIHTEFDHRLRPADRKRFPRSVHFGARKRHFHGILLHIPLRNLVVVTSSLEMPLNG